MAVGTWHEIVPPNQVPFAGAGEGMAWAPDRQRVLVQVGASAVAGRASTWSWDGSDWRLETAGGPTSPYDYAIAYDPSRGRLVVFGGELGGAREGALDETWEWNGRVWRQRFVEGPSARRTAAMAFDPSTQSMILHGGDRGADETWEYNSIGWRPVGTGGPEVTAPKLAFDAARGRVVMVGDLETPGTWVWDGAAWTEIAGPGPAARSDAALAYDPGERALVLSGGVGADGVALSDVWHLQGSEWRRAGQFASRFAHGMAFDTARQQLVVFGGRTHRTVSWLRDTLVRDDGRWRNAVRRRDLQPPVSMDHNMVYDVARSETVLYDGQEGRTWTWDGVRWQLARAGTQPGFRFDATMAYDRVRRRTVLFGGWHRDGALGDTWEWNGRRWRRRSVSGPTPAWSIAMAYEPREAAVVIFGGITDGDPEELTQFWKWNGRAWVEFETATIPEQRGQAAMAFDAELGQLLMTGGYSVPLDETPGMQTWYYDQTDWRLITTGAPGNRAAHSLIFDPVAGNTLLFAGFETLTRAYDSLGDLWVWDGTRWSELTAARGAAWPHPDHRPKMVYDEERDEFVLVGRDMRNGTWVYRRGEP